MFVVGMLIGIYGYFIFALGLLGILTKQSILVVTVVFIVGSIFYQKLHQGLPVLSFPRWSRKSDKLIFILLALLVLQAGVNLIGTLGPELAFDALWYHLTLPKVYLMEHAIRFIPGGLLYYSAMPKLTEMLYTAAIALHSEILAKGIHFLFGILICVTLFQMTRRYFPVRIALLTLVIFYSNLVVGWESITAYIDLSRTFFELLALWAFLRWREHQERDFFLVSAVMVGLAISTKLLSLGSLLIFLCLTCWVLYSEKKNVTTILRSLGVYLFIALCIPLPWFVFSWLNTGNPVYPFFTSTYDTTVSLGILSPLRIFNDLREIFTKAADPLSPLYLMFLPLLFVFYKRFSPVAKIICMYSLLALFIWYITPRTGGGRFMVPYLPAFSFLGGAIIYEIGKPREKAFRFLYAYAIFLVIIVSCIGIGFRALANKQYLPVVLGLEKKEEFLSRELNFSYGDFYDTDGYFKKTLKSDDRVLLYGFHNIYYVDFPFLHETTVKKGDTFTYIAVQNGALPKRFWYWPEIYYNPITNVRVYSLQGQKWVY